MDDGGNNFEVYNLQYTSYKHQVGNSFNRKTTKKNIELKLN